MNKKTVVSVLVCIVIVGFAISANAADIFSEDFNTRTPWYLNHYFPDSNTWEITYDQQGWDYATVWWDVTSNWKVVPPEDPNDANLWFLVLGQWGKSDYSDAGVVTKEYQNVSGLTYLNVELKASLESYGDPIIQLKVKFWDNITNLTPKGEVVMTFIDPNIPTDRLVWKNYKMTITVPSGAGIAKFTLHNESRAYPIAEGTVWLDNFLVSDVVCMDPPSLDISGDCKVGFADLAILASQWLTCGKANQAECWQ